VPPGRAAGRRGMEGTELTTIGGRRYFGIFAALAQGADGARVQLCDPYDAPFAEVYDVGAPGIDGDLAFFLERARLHGGPILELGCGSGRVAIGLAKAGYSVEAIDRSTTMLARAADRVPRAGFPEGSLDLVHDDLFARADVGRYGLIIVAAVMFPTFMATGGVAWLERLRRALRPGGALCFDVGEAPRGDGALMSRQVATDSGVIRLVEGFSVLPTGGHVFNAYAEAGHAGGYSRHLASETVLTISEAQLRGSLCAAGLQVAHTERLGGAGELASQAYVVVPTTAPHNRSASVR
jgi:SAM-dependent methyltransferase